MRYMIGVGNYSAFDDSIGIRIIEHICARGLEDGFRAVDLSSNSLNLLSYLDKDTESILIIDSAKMGRPPGTYVFFKPEDVETRKELTHFSTHEGDFLKTLALAKDMGYSVPPVTFMGIEPAEIKNAFGLSALLQAKLEEYVRAAIARCNC